MTIWQAGMRPIQTSKREAPVGERVIEALCIHVDCRDAINASRITTAVLDRLIEPSDRLVELAAQPFHAIDHAIASKVNLEPVPAGRACQFRVCLESFKGFFEYRQALGAGNAELEPSARVFGQEVVHAGDSSTSTIARIKEAVA